jgi:hypothetical protein
MYFHELKDNGFYRYHKQFIELSCLDNENFGPDHIGAMTYKSFLSWLQGFHKIKYEYSREEVEALKVKYAADTLKIEAINRQETERQTERENWLKNRPQRPLERKMNSATDGITALVSEPLSASHGNTEDILEVSK